MIALQKNNVVVIALFTAGILLVPLVAMQFSDNVNWKLNDFVTAGVLLFITGLALNSIITRVQSRKRSILALSVVVLAFLYLWAELAVGIFTNWGS